MRKNLPLWAITLDSWWLSADLGLLKGSGAAPGGSRDLTHTEPNVAIGEHPTPTSHPDFWHPSQVLIATTGG